MGKLEDGKIGYLTIENDLKSLTGAILTIIDSAIIEEKQNKAVKDLIKAKFSRLLYRYQDYCSQGNWGHSVVLEDK